tara:strand:- start:2229 stop:3053 length:825 start_codon:yes stop_codon:yes gene_type:complete
VVVDPDLTFAEYRDWDAVNISRLKKILVSPKHYKYQQDKDSEAFRVGRSLHTMVLQPTQYPVLYAVWLDEQGRRYGKKWNAFKEAEAGKEIIREADYNRHLEIERAVRHDDVACKLLDEGQPEVSIMWETLGEYDCKARVDWLRDDCLVDLKTTSSVKPDDFARDAYRYGYHIQAAWYREAAFRATRKVLPFKIIAVEKESPHDVAVYRLTDEMLKDGEQTVDDALTLLELCTESDSWPGVGRGDELDLDLPAWAQVRGEMVDTVTIDGEEVGV